MRPVTPRPGGLTLTPVSGSDDPRMNNDSAQQPRTVLVTGAGTGIGRATARAFAAEGARVVAVGRRAEPLAETADGHPGVTPLPADLTAEDGPETVVRAALERYGRIDVLVNNAGVVTTDSLRTYTRTSVRPLLETNLLACS